MAMVRSIGFGQATKLGFQQSDHRQFRFFSNPMPMVISLEPIAGRIPMYCTDRTITTHRTRPPLPPITSVIGLDRTRKHVLTINSIRDSSDWYTLQVLGSSPLWADGHYRITSRESQRILQSGRTLWINASVSLKIMDSTASTSIGNIQRILRILEQPMTLQTLCCFSRN